MLFGDICHICYVLCEGISSWLFTLYFKPVRKADLSCYLSLEYEISQVTAHWATLRLLLLQDNKRARASVKRILKQNSTNTSPRDNQIERCKSLPILENKYAPGWAL